MLDVNATQGFAVIIKCFTSLDEDELKEEEIKSLEKLYRIFRQLSQDYKEVDNLIIKRDKTVDQLLESDTLKQSS